jgi:peptidyl-prolyl cis-trans isomerase A (cyclophilin A)
MLALLLTLAITPVVIETELGVIEVSLDEVRAPVTVANFLRYAGAGLYDGGIVHRTVTTSPDNQPASTIKIDVIQGGMGSRKPGSGFPAIALERTSVTGLKHLDGVISMARSGPDTATSDFFICIGNQPTLDFGGQRNPDGQGFAAFGRVTSGMDVVRRIQKSAAEGQRLTPPIRIVAVRRAASAVK